jgi:hypothetical protein
LTENVYLFIFEENDLSPGNNMKKTIIFVLIYSFQIFSFQGMVTKIFENDFKTSTAPQKEKILNSGNKFKKFEGVYRFGPGNEMKIYIKDSTLRALLPGQPEYLLLPLGENTFQLKGLSGYKMIFNLDENNKTISVTSSQPNGDFKAEKISDEAAPPKEEKTIVVPLSKLKKFEGEYEFGPGNDMKISLKDGTLKAYLKGQPEYIMLPISEKEFILKNMNGYKMIFLESEDGEVTEVISDQPNGKFKAKKVN